MLELDGKRALITAAGQGIGRATAELFYSRGCAVIAADHVTKGIRRPHSGPRKARGNRRAGDLPRQLRKPLHHRTNPCDRWRLVRLNTEGLAT